MPTDPRSPARAIEFKDLTVENDRRRTDRQWAVQDITFAALENEKTLIFGLPESGKSTLMDAVHHPAKYPGRVAVNVETQELFLKDSHAWTASQYAAKYDAELRPGTYVLVDDAYDEGMPYLVRLDRGMLVLAGISGHECFHRFDRLLYLYGGRIQFDGTPRAFFDWVKATSPRELEFRLADYLVESGGEMPGCPELDE